MKKFPISLLCGIAAIIITIILFFTILGNTLLAAIHFISLVAIVLAEAIATGYAVISKGSPRKVAAAVIVSIMVPFSIILSVVYIVNFPKGYGTYLGWYFAGTVLVNALAWTLCHFNANKSAENTQLQAAKQNMLALRNLVKCVMAEPAAKAYEKQLRALEQSLHFSNDCVIAPEDESIRQMLLQLQASVSDPECDVAKMLTDIETAVKRRTAMN